MFASALKKPRIGVAWRVAAASALAAVMAFMAVGCGDDEGGGGGGGTTTPTNPCYGLTTAPPGSACCIASPNFTGCSGPDVPVDTTGGGDGVIVIGPSAPPPERDMGPAAGVTPVAHHGQLRTEGAYIVNRHGKVAQLRGMSLYWSMGPGTGAFYNADVVKYLRDDWKGSVIRAAMGINENWGGGQSGYLAGDNSAGVSNKQRVKDVVDGAIEHGIYVIIDWHSHAAENNTQDAVAFFQEMATAYGHLPNVIYEIYNEPVAQAWSTVIKPYSQTVVNAIRAIDPDNLILIGTRQYCQQVEEAALSPVNGDNLAYVMHFYAASHGQSLRDNTIRALSAGKPVFVSEFGTVGADGKGTPDIASSNIWMDFMDGLGLSWANWSLSNISEGASALTGASTNPVTAGAWDNNVTASGSYIRDKMRAAPNTTAANTYYTLTVKRVGQGDVGVDPNRALFLAGERVTLVAVAASGWVFSGWSGAGLSGNAMSQAVTVNGNVEIKATFTRR